MILTLLVLGARRRRQGRDTLGVRGDLDLSECFIDATFIVAKKGRLRVGKTKRGKGTKLMAVADSNGLPVAVYAASASPHEGSLVRGTLAEVFTAERPERLIGGWILIHAGATPGK